MHFEISRALSHGKPLTAAQRTSSLFAEEPVVMGKVLRRGLPPLIITEAQFKVNEVTLKRLFKAGAICIKAVDKDKVIDLASMDAEKEIKEKIPEAADELQTLKEEEPKEEPKEEIKQEVKEEVVIQDSPLPVVENKKKRGKAKNESV